MPGAWLDTDDVFLLSVVNCALNTGSSADKYRLITAIAAVIYANITCAAYGSVTVAV